MGSYLSWTACVQKLSNYEVLIWIKVFIISIVIRKLLSTNARYDYNPIWLLIYLDLFLKVVNCWRNSRPWLRLIPNRSSKSITSCTHSADPLKKYWQTRRPLLRWLRPAWGAAFTPGSEERLPRLELYWSPPLFQGPWHVISYSCSLVVETCNVLLVLCSRWFSRSLLIPLFYWSWLLLQFLVPVTR